MALLRVLLELSVKPRWRLTVAHFNHQLRGADSDTDEEFVQYASANLKLPFVSGRSDVTASAKQERLSIEMAARRLRHEFLARTARRLKIRSVALAHHADDQVELFFLRLLRGAGGEGLGGMKWTSPSPADSTIRLVRPLLDQSKAALRCFVEEKQIPYRDDATNAQLDFLRNRVRNKLLPLLAQKYQPALTRTVLRAMDIVGAEADFVRCAAEDWLKQENRIAFGELHLAIQRQIIQLQLQQTGITSGFDLVEELRKTVGKPMSVQPNLTVHRDCAGRIIKRSVARADFIAGEIVLELDGGGGVGEFDGLNIRWQISTRDCSAKGMPKFARHCEHFDADKVGSLVVLRHWRAGDRFQPIGMKTPIKLQDLFTNQKVPRRQRHQVVVATTASGQLFWIEGVRIAERFKLDKQTMRRLKWRWSRRESAVADDFRPC